MTRVLTSAEHAEVVPDRERDRVAWNLPGQPAPVLDPRGADHQETVQRGLDWQGFLSLYFPGRRRHDLAALTAYGAYKASPDIDEPSPEEVLLGSAAAEAWEDEGGAAL